MTINMIELFLKLIPLGAILLIILIGVGAKKGMFKTITLSILILSIPFIFIIKGQIYKVEESKQVESVTYELKEIAPNSEQYVIDNYPDNNTFDNINGVVKSKGENRKSGNRVEIKTLDKENHLDINIKTYNETVDIIQLKNAKPTITLNKIESYDKKYLGLIKITPEDKLSYDIILPE